MPSTIPNVQRPLPSTLDLAPRDPRLDDLAERDHGRSNVVAFLLGGVVISGSLLAFLYYDSDNLSSRDMMTAGSLSRIEAPAPRLAPPPAILAPSVQP